jgi:hypothetical protein
MLLNRLANLCWFVVMFSVVFSIAALILTINHVISYVSRLFDLPVVVINTMIERQDEAKDEKV